MLLKVKWMSGVKHIGLFKGKINDEIFFSVIIFFLSFRANEVCVGISFFFFPTSNHKSQTPNLFDLSACPQPRSGSRNSENKYMDCRVKPDNDKSSMSFLT